MLLLTGSNTAAQMAIGESILSQMKVVDTLQEALANTTSKQWLFVQFCVVCFY